jgi:hypothetical protein
MGDVYECFDEKVGRGVVVKIARPDLADTPGALEKIRDEARRLAGVKDRRYVPRVLLADDLTLDGVTLPWVATELEEGAEVLGGPQSAAWGVDRKVRVLAKLCRAVAGLHAQHLVHADIKPSNVLVVGDEPRLIDFGIARAVTRLGGEPTDAIGGTPGYLDPALHAHPHARPDQRSDVYALALTAAAFLSGRESDRERSVKTASWPSRAHPPSEAARAVDPDLDAILIAALDDEPSARPTAAELGERLEAWLASRRSVWERVRLAAHGADMGVRRALRERAWLRVVAAATVGMVVAVAASPLLFRYTTIGGLTQGLAGERVEAGTVGPVRIIRITDQAAFVRAAEARGVKMTPGAQPGWSRPGWALLARTVARAGGARVVGLDVHFDGDSAFDADLVAALEEEAASSEAGVTIVHLERWRGEMPAALAASGRIRAGCGRAVPPTDLPPVMMVAVQPAGTDRAYLGLSLLMTAAAERPGWEPRGRLDLGPKASVLAFERRDAGGSWVMAPGPLVTDLQEIHVVGQRDAEEGLEEGDVVAYRIVVPAPEAELAEATLDAVRALEMPPGELRSWIAGRPVLLCAAASPAGRDSAVPWRGRLVPGSDLLATHIGTALTRPPIRHVELREASVISWLSGLAGALMGLAAMALTRGCPRWLVAAGVFLGAAGGVLVAGSGCLWIGAAAGYVVNPMAPGLAAAVGCVACAAMGRAAPR